MTADFSRRMLRPLTPMLVACAVLGVLGGCAATQLTDLWRDPNYAGPPAKKVFVVSMAKDPARRRMWEDTYVAAIRKQGADATASYTFFPAAVPDTESVKQKVREVGFDAVIVSHFIGTENVERFVPPTTTTVPVSYGSPWGYYRTYYEQVQQPGYVENDKVVRFQTDLWVADGKGGRLVWMARSESVNPGSPSEVTKEVTGEVVPELKKVKLLP